MMKNKWIPIEYKEFYSDFPNSGLNVRFLDEEINNLLRQESIKFFRWLRRKFWFPIKCKIFFEYYSCYIDAINGNDRAIAIFYPAEDNKTDDCLRVYPSIKIAVADFDKEAQLYGEEMAIEYYFYTVAHELTHYYQWYFLESGKRSARSLEIEANKCAYSVVEAYFKSAHPKKKQ